MYEYKFELGRCWYTEVCKHYRTDKCRANCLRFMEMDYLFYSSGIPVEAQYPVTLLAVEVDIECYKRLKEIKDNIVDFVANGDNLFIGSSECGNGKTTWAIKLMSKYFDSIWAGNGFECRGKFVNVSEFLMTCKLAIGNNNKEIARLREQLCNVDLVIWDDIGDADVSKYEYQLLYSIINRRLLDRRANIFTSNSLANALEQKIGPRLHSRIYNSSEVIEFLGADRRNMH